MKGDISVVDTVTTTIKSSSSLQAAIYKVPFCNLPEPNFDLLVQTATTRRDAAIHYAVHLREDPPYYEHCLKQWRDHLGHKKENKIYDASRWLVIFDAFQMI